MSELPQLVLTEMANGVFTNKGKFFPFVVTSFTSSGTLPALKTGRYYIDWIYINSNNTAAAAGLVDKVTATFRKITSIVHQITPPTTYAASNEGLCEQIDGGFLTDMDTAVTITLATVTPFCAIKYAVIDTPEGEYSS